MNKNSLTYFFLAAATIVFTLFYFNSESASFQNKPAKGIGKTFLTDTTKPTINHRYVLKGSDTMFILLQNLMISPDDITPRQKNLVMDWFRQNVKVDSTKK